MEVDALLEALGRPGRYSLALYLLLCTNYAMVSISHFTMVIYTAPVPYHCAAPERPEVSEHRNNTTAAALDSCSVYSNASSGGDGPVRCEAGWTYDAKTGERNILMEFDLVCDREYLNYLATTIYFLGVMLGGLTFGPLAETYGRRPVLLGSLVAAVGSSVVLTLSHTYVSFVLIRLANGFFLQGVYGTTFVLVMEQSPPGLRTYAGTFIELFWAAGIMVLAVVSYLLPDWRLTQLAVTMPSVLIVVGTWFVPESLRWLVMHRKYNQAEKVLRTAARCNGTDLPKALFLDCRDDGALACNEPGRNVRSYTDDLPALKAKEIESNEKSVHTKDTGCDQQKCTALDMFRTPKLRRWSCVFAFNWFTVSVVLYGLSSMITTMQGNKYVILFLCGAAEVPTNVMSAFIFQRFGRKIPLCVFMLVAGLCSTAGAFLPHSQDIGWMETTLALVSRTCTMMCFTVLNIYTCEVFPTIIRNTSVGVCAFFTRFGGVVSPQVILLGATSFVKFPLLVFGALSLLGGLLTLSLPETLNQNLPDTIEQAEAMTSVHPGSKLP
ncbi:hypothetical protein NP493_477g01038 [Ridgeia piscesae]|uniref:Major facilitator superfamily (MFS) profile domain-containing protein n=1 Tax=Ridgeia piscesae TaxID=27915 RepID=A0AAD9NRG4_RIDPI|nr:hypothetical protein NP493_477g01038 [Ridgeia piscesae]